MHLRTARPPRIAFYSHDTMGLGHMRRNALLARRLAGPPISAVTLMIAGAPEAAQVSMAAGITCVALPPLAKHEGRYRSRSLPLDLAEVVSIRRDIIRATLDAFGPDLFVVDNVPRGAEGELDLALRVLRSRRQTRCVLGLRDVLDSPLAVRREWQLAGNLEAIRACYDEVWIYGDPAVYDAVREYGFPADIAARTHYTGYLNQRARLSGRNQADATDDGPHRTAPATTLCSVGGGQDGGALALAFAEAERPPGTSAVIITGPFMPPAAAAQLRSVAAVQPDLQILGFVREPLWLLAGAERVIAMGGYNTIAEVLSYRKRALIVPRVAPRREQSIRAERLAELGHVDVLELEMLSPARLAAWLGDASPARSAQPVDLRGLERVSEFSYRLLARDARVALAGGVRSRG